MFSFCFPWKSDMPSYEERFTWRFDFAAARPMKYPNLQERPNECDELDGEEEHRVTITTAKLFLRSMWQWQDLNYRDAVVFGLNSGEATLMFWSQNFHSFSILQVYDSSICDSRNTEIFLPARCFVSPTCPISLIFPLPKCQMPALGIHLLAIRRSTGCPVGRVGEGDRTISQVSSTSGTSRWINKWTPETDQEFAVNIDDMAYFRLCMSSLLQARPWVSSAWLWRWFVHEGRTRCLWAPAVLPFFLSSWIDIHQDKSN